MIERNAIKLNYIFERVIFERNILLLFCALRASNGLCKNKFINEPPLTHVVSDEIPYENYHNEYVND